MYAITATLDFYGRIDENNIKTLFLIRLALGGQLQMEKSLSDRVKYFS